MSKWVMTKVSQFLFEREGKYKPDASEIAGLNRIEKIDFQGRFHIASKTSKTNMIIVQNGDLVISGINVSKGALGIYEGKDPVTATIHYSAYTFDKDQIHIDYLKRFLKSPKFVELLKEQVRGGIKTEIKPKHMLSLEIPLPPIDQQKRIISKFEKIETEDRELREEINHQKVLIRKIRQQILQDGVEGKLTADWRIENQNVEPASKLLDHISTEKEALIRCKKIKKQKALLPIKSEEKPFLVPESWLWCRLDQVIYESPRNGYSPKAVDFPTSTKTLKLGATTKGVFDAREYKYINEEIDDSSHLWLKKGDILIQRSNSLDHVGISAIYDKEDNSFIYPDIMMKVKASTKMSIDFLHAVLTSDYCREYFRSNATGAQKSMPKINQGIVSSTLIPLPPAEEQEEIIRKIKDIFCIVDMLDVRINRNMAQASQLLQTVSKETFTQIDDKHKSSDDVLELKPSNSKQIDYYKRSLLAAEIVDRLRQEPTLGKLKLQKIIFLCQKTQQMELPTNFLQQAAGPYDPQMARSLDKQFKDKKWFVYKKNDLKKYQPLENAGEHKQDYQKYFANDDDGISYIVNLFRKSRSEELEAVATLYACWEAILNSGQTFSEGLLLERFYAWSEEKQKFSREQLIKYIDWMTDKKICPALKGSS